MLVICVVLKYSLDDEDDEVLLDASLMDYDDDFGAETIMLEDDNLYVMLLNVVKNYKLLLGEIVYELFIKFFSKRLL